MFTQGAWEIHENATLEIHPVGDEDGEYVIAEIPADASGDKSANASLICASPKLLDALLAMSMWCDYNNVVVVNEAFMGSVRNILKQAKGEK